jgi:hypothetical protein
MSADVRDGDGLRRRLQLDGGSAAYLSEAHVATGCLSRYRRWDGGIVGRAEGGGDLLGGSSGWLVVNCPRIV